MRFLWLIGFVALVAVAIFYHRHPPSTATPIGLRHDRPAGTATERPTPDLGVATDVGAEVRDVQTGARRTADVERALRRSREEFEKLNARFPGTKEKLLASYRIDAALRFGEFFAQAGIVGEQRDRLIELLADEIDAPNRGELGEREEAEMRQLIGDEKFEQMRAYAKLSPGLQRADEVVARLRDARVNLGETEAGVREIAAGTADATEEIKRRVYQGTPLEPEEEGQLAARARARFEPLRHALSAAGDERAFQVLDNWIAQKIAADLKFTREVLARQATRKSR